MSKKIVNREELAKSKIELLVYEVRDRPYTYRIQVKNLLEKIVDLNHVKIWENSFADGDCLIFPENEKSYPGMIDIYHLKSWLEFVNSKILEFLIAEEGIYIKTYPGNTEFAFFKFRTWFKHDHKSLYLPVVLNVFNKEQN